MKPISGMDTQICMGASIGMGIGLRKVLPEEQARKVVSVIGDSTFMHSGLTGLLEMVYNPPATGHVVVVVDNSTTAMTGQQEHPGTGRKLDHSPAYAVSIEDVAKAIGVQNVVVFKPVTEGEKFQKYLEKNWPQRTYTHYSAPAWPIGGGGNCKEKGRGEIALCKIKLQMSESPPRRHGSLKGVAYSGELCLNAGTTSKSGGPRNVAKGRLYIKRCALRQKSCKPYDTGRKNRFSAVARAEWSDTHIQSLAPDGVVLSANSIDASNLRNAKAINVAVLGMLSKKLDIPREKWLEVLKKFFPQKLHDANESAFILGENSI